MLTNRNIRATQFLCFLGLVGIDQYTKYLARTHLDGSPIVLTDWLSLRLLHNPGAAFSLPVPLHFTVILSIIIIGFLIYTLYKRPFRHWGEAMALILLTAGATGNFIDRLVFSSVTDFIAYMNFPVFNVADTYITISLLMVLVGGFVTETRGKKN